MILSNSVNTNINNKNDYVFIVESIDKPIEVSTTTTTEGCCEYMAVVAKFGIVNENGREYQRDDYLAQLPQLLERIKKNSLMGELDHPQNYDTSLKNVSHVITNIWYDQSDDCVKVTLKLLDTPYGQIAKTLIDAGVQLSISSRSAGRVDGNGIVSLFKIFTFDLVAEPGFAQAILQPTQAIKENFKVLNESLDNLNQNSIINNLELLYEGKMYGDSTKVYKVNENDIKLFEKNLNQKYSKNNINEMNSNVTRQEFNEYSKAMVQELANLKKLLEAKAQDDDAQAQSQSQAQAQSQAQGQAQGYAQGQAQGQVQGQAQGQAQGQIQGQAQGQIQGQAQGQAQGYAQGQAQGQIQGQTQAQPFGQAQGQAQAQPYGQPQGQSQAMFGGQAQPMDMGSQPSNFGAQIQGAQAQGNPVAEVPQTADGQIPNVQDTFETVQKLIQYINFIAKQLEAVMGHSEVVTEMLNRSINYSEKIGSVLNEHISYTNAQGKLLNETIGYTQELAGIINNNGLVTEKTVSYLNLIGTKLNESIELSNVIADKTQKAIEFTEFNAQMFNEHVDFTNMLANEINGTNFTNAKAEGVTNRNLNDNVASISESNDVLNQVNKVLEKINERSNESVLMKQFPFLTLLSESNRQEFYKLDNDTKSEIVATLQSGYYGNEADVVSTIHNVLENKNKQIPNYLKFMPDKYKAIYESLDEASKAEIARKAGSGYYRLNTPYQIKSFWDSMNMVERGQAIQESKEYAAINESRCQNTEGTITAQQYADLQRGYDKSYIQMMTRHAQNH